MWLSLRDLENSIIILLFWSEQTGSGANNNYSPRFRSCLRMRPYAADETLLPKKSGRHNLAALGTTTGQNLAAVGSSHSLTETVDLGTMTAAGLVGTLHSDTPPMMKFYAQYRKYRHSNPCLWFFAVANTVVPTYYNRKASPGQPLFFLFFDGTVEKCQGARSARRRGRQDSVQRSAVVFGCGQIIYQKTAHFCENS